MSSAEMVSVRGCPPPPEDSPQYSIGADGSQVVRFRKLPLPLLPVLGKEPMGSVLRDRPRQPASARPWGLSIGPSEGGTLSSPAPQSPLERLRLAHESKRGERGIADQEASQWKADDTRQRQQRRQRLIADRLASELQSEQQHWAERQRCAQQQASEREFHATSLQRHQSLEQRQRQLQAEARERALSEQRDEMRRREQLRREAAAAQALREKAQCHDADCRRRAEYWRHVAEKRENQRRDREQWESEVHLRAQREREQLDHERREDSAAMQRTLRAALRSRARRAERRRQAAEVHSFVCGQISERRQRERAEREHAARPAPLPPSVPGGRPESARGGGCPSPPRNLPLRPAPPPRPCWHNVPQTIKDHHGRNVYTWGNSL
eukprot:TRINITY_DN4869_c0_g1_i1.p1 TRINITY_DN4869_c0_g1~~TRINITY_DN4869_c0_g1_i1.p1  ORF type:complete len:405 (+),score=139.57 TRINITY_DN4869_c0_g1_i1:74-1216(+)